MDSFVGYISVQTTVVAEDCVVAKMAEFVEEAQNNKSKTQRFIDECAKYYTPGTPYTSYPKTIALGFKLKNTACFCMQL